MGSQLWSWALTAVGVTGFVLAGRKVWWAWYINIACQALWLAYALTTHQYGFIVAAGVYTWVFTRNAIRWTREHRAAVADRAAGTCPVPGCDYWVETGHPASTALMLREHTTEAH